jgi:hypothetical protein
MLRLRHKLLVNSGQRKGRAVMQKKPYETPKVHELGSLTELTQESNGDKCAGSNDQFVPSLSPRFAGDCPSTNG